MAYPKPRPQLYETSSNNFSRLHETGKNMLAIGLGAAVLTAAAVEFGRKSPQANPKIKNETFIVEQAGTHAPGEIDTRLETIKVRK